MAYITLQDMRDEGVTNPPYGDSYVTSRITLAQSFIERILGIVFEKKTALTLKVDGRGHPLIWLPLPPVSESAITSIKYLYSDGTEEVVDASEYFVDMPQYPDGRLNPTLVNRSGVWTKGIKNYSITGDFGFVDVDGQGVCTTPVEIKRLCKLITKWALPEITDDAGRRANQIVAESLKDYSYSLDAKIKRGMFGDPEIDGILGMFHMSGMGTA